MKHQSKSTNEKEMFSLVKSCLDSGTSKREYLRQNGISEGIFYFWYKKYKASIAKQEDKFIPLVIPETSKHPEQKTTVTKKTELEICYPNGVKVKLTQELDLTVLRSLISIL